MAAVEEDGSGAVMGALKIHATLDALTVESTGGNFLFALREATLIGALFADISAEIFRINRRS